MYSRTQLAEIIEQYIANLNYPVEPSKLYEPIKYTMESSGKRIRPTVTLMACNIFSDDIKIALPGATAIEMFHNFTLLHDDIMDNADVRRGKPSVHKKWGQNTAILSGDAMTICAYSLLQKTDPRHLPSVLLEFNKLALEVCEGQQYDMDFESRDEVSIEEYMNMIRLKTAVLIAGAAKIGAIIGGASEQEAEVMYRFGNEVGLAFQLQDDYLDTYGTFETLGKIIGGDIEESKKTFLTINALKEAGDATRRAMLATFRDTGTPLDQKINRIKTIYNSLDIPEITKAAIESHLSNADSALNELNTTAERLEPLRELLGTLRNRNK